MNRRLPGSRQTTSAARCQRLSASNDSDRLFYYTHKVPAYVCVCVRKVETKSTDECASQINRVCVCLAKSGSGAMFCQMES